MERDTITNGVVQNSSLLDPSECKNVTGINPSRLVCSDSIPIQTSSSLIIPSIPTDSVRFPSATGAHQTRHWGSSAAAAQDKFLVFDKSGDRTNLLFSSVSPSFWNLNQIGGKQKASSGNNNGEIGQSGESRALGGNGDDGMCEDMDEIDALLCSDSDSEGVGSSNVPPTKRKIFEEIDTASSALKFDDCRDGGGNDESSDVKDDCRDGDGVGIDISISKDGCPNKRLKRDEIRETICILGGIVPGGKGKDTTVILDTAIWYLRSLMSDGCESSKQNKMSLSTSTTSLIGRSQMIGFGGMKS